MSDKWDEERDKPIADYVNSVIADLRGRMPAPAMTTRIFETPEQMIDELREEIAELRARIIQLEKRRNDKTYYG